VSGELGLPELGAPELDRPEERRRALASKQRGDAITIANEFAEIRVSRVETRNGSRLLIESSKSGQWVALCPLELEALTWQGPETFSAMIGHPFGSLIGPQDEA